MRMQQSLADLESAFVEEIAEDRERRERLARRAEQRARQRHMEKAQKHGTIRYVVLVLTLLGTALLVTWVMFWALYQLTS